MAAARAAFEGGPWAEMKPAERQGLLLRMADIMEENAETLAELEAVPRAVALKTVGYSSFA